MAKNSSQIQDAIRKLRIIIKSGAFTEPVKDKAWAAMLALQWSRASDPEFTLTILDLIGIPIESQSRIKSLSRSKGRSR